MAVDRLLHTNGSPETNRVAAVLPTLFGQTYQRFVVSWYVSYDLLDSPPLIVSGDESRDCC
jgi:hypothetical protein